MNLDTPFFSQGAGTPNPNFGSPVTHEDFLPIGGEAPTFTRI
jgi:hypothetical protein